MVLIISGSAVAVLVIKLDVFGGENSRGVSEKTSTVEPDTSKTFCLTFINIYMYRQFVLAQLFMTFHPEFSNTSKFSSTSIYKIQIP